MSARGWTYLFCLYITFAATVAMAAPIDVARMERAIDLRVSTGQFMGTVLVAQDGKLLINKGYGLADLAQKTPNDPNTKFRLGSVTKQFTAASILLLEERGKLKVEDSVKKYLPDAPAAWDGITIFHLLTHTSGIPNFTGFPEYRSTQGVAVTPAQLVARFRDKPLDFPPGTAWNYSNSGYALLGYLIERVSGVPYARFVHDNLFVPLGMNDSGYDSSTTKIARHAIGYAPGPSGPVVADYIDMSVPFSAGALYSTTGDLLRWNRALYGGKVLKPASLQKMTTPFKNNYAFGLGVQPDPRGGQVISHNGGIDGFNTHLAYFTADKLSVIVLANLNGPAADQIATDLRKVAEGEPGTLISDRVIKPVPTEVLRRLAGHYAGPEGAVYTLSQKEDHLLSQRGATSMELYPQSSTEFFARTVDAQVVFEDDAHGNVADAVVQFPNQKATLVRISDEEAQRRADALAKREREHVATPGGEAAVRRSLEELAAGTPSYDRMGPQLAEATRQQLPALQRTTQSFGPIKSIDFKAPGPSGGDIYNVTFANGSVVKVTIILDPDGKIVFEQLEPASR